jgi:predicted NBD/HSP70 family sugar kinase
VSDATDRAAETSRRAVAAPPGPRFLRRLSEQAVLETIMRDGPISRAEIARRTGLSKPTVSSVVARLVSDRLVSEIGRRTGNPGRAAVLYEVDPGARLVVGIDLGGTKVRAAVADLQGEFLAEIREPTDRYGGKRLLTQVATLARRVIATADADRTRLSAIGLATPGVTDPATGRIRLAPNLPWLHRIDLRSGLATELGVPVVLDNDVNLAAVGERWHGLARGVSTFAFIAVGTGVGMGLVLDGELFTGARGAAGEIAYLPLSADPFDPAHRARGAFEDETSGSTIAAAARAHAEWRGAVPTSAEEVFSRAAEGDQAAAEIIAHEARALAMGIAAVCAVIDPELIVLGGGIGSNPHLLGTVRDALGRLLPGPPPVERSALGNAAPLHGAVAVALRLARERLLPLAGGEPSSGVTGIAAGAAEA